MVKKSTCKVCSKNLTAVVLWMTWGNGLNLSRRKETGLVFLCISTHGNTCKLESLLLVYVARLIFFNLKTTKEYQRSTYHKKRHIKDIGLLQDIQLHVEKLQYVLLQVYG